MATTTTLHSTEPSSSSPATKQQTYKTPDFTFPPRCSSSRAAPRPQRQEYTMEPRPQNLTLPPRYSLFLSAPAFSSAASSDDSGENCARTGPKGAAAPRSSAIPEEQPAQRWVPDMTFPPRRNTNAERTERNYPRTMPEIETSVKRGVESKIDTVGFSSTMHVENVQGYPASPSKDDIIAGITPGPETTEESELELPAQPTRKSGFLSLPYELRLEIYYLTIASHRAIHSHLAPAPASRITSPNTVPPSAAHTQPTGFALPIVISNPGLTFPSLLPDSPSNPTTRGKLPTGLLASCKQIYEEAHRLPFESNAFTFVNWFWSGVYAARQFSRCTLKPWQRGALRRVGVEVLARDLMNSGRSCHEWVDLCQLWKGVKELRLGICGPLESPSSVDENLLDPAASWICKGLCAMDGLRTLDIGIETASLEREEKLLFCRRLEVVLNAEREEGHVSVRFLEAATTTKEG
ncbi:hypothetical protein BP6252_01746 [Coleophoma cylindrospora]|uniref:Uncharacterized protein n=1 Tax=Coleophoma cylindrospora TaxID=1849047 RepID=A0A3D8STY0_9HELO|nr:hypothetical protein BP6252_01746 [Coleophoma cylindrospora]